MSTPIPDGDLNRSLVLASPFNAKGQYVSAAGGIYTILVSGEDTAGRYCLIEMLVPDGGRPPPHRHAFEEMFYVLEGELEFMFRGELRSAIAGTTVNIPSNAPHTFRNKSGKPARLLCMCMPAGQNLMMCARRFDE